MFDARRRLREESRLGLGADVGAGVKLTHGFLLRRRDWPKRRLKRGLKTHFNNDERDDCLRLGAGQARA